MRTNPAAIQAALDSGGPLVGDFKAQSRLTVDPTFYMRPSSGPLGNRPANKLPVRWWQDKANSQASSEIEVPNLQQVMVTRSLTSQAGTLQVIMRNTNTPANGLPGDNPDAFGQPGYYSYARGSSPDALARWNQPKNEFANLLRENALLRLYQGYGGENLTIPEALAAGNLILVGVFLVDSVAITAGESSTGAGGGYPGTITLNARDMAKLLIDQYAWPPLVPQAFYTSQGILYVHDQVIPPFPGYGTASKVIQQLIAYGTCSANGSGAPNALVDGHSPSSCLSSITSDFYLSEGFTTADPAQAPWIQFSSNENVSAVNLTADPGISGFTVYVQVMENGAWATDPHGGVIDGIPYVLSFGITTTGGWTYLPRKYAPTLIRFTFSNLPSTAYNPPYRASLKHVEVGVTGAAAQSKSVQDFAFTYDGGGYWIVGTDGTVTAYGDAQLYGSLAGVSLSGGIIGIGSTVNSLGYWLCGSDGGVFTFGNAVYYGGKGGAPLNAPIVAFDVTQSGNGYVLCGSDGGVFTYGDAVFKGSLPVSAIVPTTSVVDIALRPQNDGYWLVTEDGTIYAYGNAVNYGNFSSTPISDVTGISPSATGLGYHIVTGTGEISVRGDASILTGASAPHITTGENQVLQLPLTLNEPISGIKTTPNGGGYSMVAQDGGIFTYGNAQFLGALPSTFLDTTGGNYKDYCDIVSDFLLWAGFWLMETGIPPTQPPKVFGNIEATGAWNYVGNIPSSTFDKTQIIDCISQIAQIVGYIFRVDETGGARFESPNWWSPGNFNEVGVHSTTFPVLDEQLNMMSYTQTTADTGLVSEIIVASTDPYLFDGHPNNVTVTRFIPPNIANLKGIIKPAMIGVPLNVPVSAADQAVMAELLGIQAYFTNRQGSATALFDPSITPDTQVKIYERSTGEANIHYVTGVSTEHYIDEGYNLATYTTYWLGNENNWVINANTNSLLQGSSLTNTTYNDNGVLVSQELLQFLANSGSEKVKFLIGNANIQAAVFTTLTQSSIDLLNPTLQPGG